MEALDIIGKIRQSISYDNISSTLANALMDMIKDGTIPQGYLFSGELMLCESLGISRSSLREAYKVLEASGYISRSKRGTIVNPQTDVIRNMPFVTALGQTDFNDLIEFRSIFESQTVYLTALRADQGCIAKLEYDYTMMNVHKDNIDLLSKYDMDFHLTVAKGSGNKLLMTTMEMVSDVFSKSVNASFHVDTEENIVHALKCHKAILEAVKQRDAKAARRAMTEHIAEIRARGM